MFKNIKSEIGRLFLLIIKSEKQSRIFAILFLIAITLGVFYPNESFGESIWTILIKTFTEFGQQLINAIILAIGVIIIVITSSLVALSTSLVLYLISPEFSSGAILNNFIVNTGWSLVRDLTNMLIVLGFVIVGLATILRIKEYEAQKKLIPLIIVAILVNFSKLFAGIVIDASNIIMNHFLTQGGTIASGYAELVTNQVNTILDNALSRNPAENLTRIVGLAFFHTIIFVIFLIYSFVFLFRHFALWVSVILSPLAFFCSIFNFSKRIWSMWINTFIQWAFVGIPISFFLWLADMIFAEKLSTPISDTNPAGEFVSFLFPGCLLIIGFFVSLQLGGTTTNVIKGVTNIAKQAGGKALNRLKESRAGQAVTNNYGRALESVWLRKKGTTALLQEKSREETIKRMGALYQANPSSVKKMFSGTFESDANKAAATYIMASKGELDLNNPLHVKNYQRAVATGYDVRELEKKNPNLVQYNTPKVNDRAEKIKIANPNLTPKNAQEQAVQELQREIIQNQTPIELAKNISPNFFEKVNGSMDMAVHNFESIGLSQLNSPDFRKELTQSKINALKQFITQGTEQYKAIQNRIKSLRKDNKQQEADELLDKLDTIKTL